MERKYESRTELEKIKAQWTKLSGLHDREEWSAAVIRAATAAELAATYAIRREFEQQSQLDKLFVDSLLIWANGLANKIAKLLVPLTSNHQKKEKIKNLQKLAEKINTKRNDIAHKGVFSNRKTSTETIEECKKFVEGLVQIYDDSFKLRDKVEKEFQ